VFITPFLLDQAQNPYTCDHRGLGGGGSAAETLLSPEMIKIKKGARPPYLMSISNNPDRFETHSIRGDVSFRLQFHSPS
jgi:hypothetical protein